MDQAITEVRLFSDLDGPPSTMVVVPPTFVARTSTSTPRTRPTRSRAPGRRPQVNAGPLSSPVGRRPDPAGRSASDGELMPPPALSASMEPRSPDRVRTVDWPAGVRETTVASR